MHRIIALLSLLVLPLHAWAQGIHEYELDNGMRVIVRPDHRAPVVVSQIWYRVGSSYEHRPITGVSHVLEHMMFKGTEKLGPGEFSRIIALNGGRENAFTSSDYTAYFQQLSADRLPIALELEADRMHNLVLSQQEFEREVEVVKEERRQRVEDNPNAQLMERFRMMAYPASPYGQPVIGWMQDLNNLTLADLEAWYRRWYAPDNAILVVVGDVQPDRVHQLASQHFGSIPSRDVAPPRPTSSLEGAGERRLTARLAAELPSVVIGYQVPSLTTTDERWEPYALEVLAGVLDGGSAARLPSRLVRGRELAAGVGAGYSMVGRLDSLFTFSGTPSANTTVDALEEALHAEVERLKQEPVDELELERAKNQLMADHLFELDSMFYQAMQIGILETVGIGWRELERYEEGVRAVTAEQIQNVARRYLVPERRTVGILEPVQGGLQQ